MQWYLIDNDHVIRERLREAEQARLAAEARRAARVKRASGGSRRSRGNGSAPVTPALLGSLVARFAGR